MRGRMALACDGGCFLPGQPRSTAVRAATSAARGGRAGVVRAAPGHLVVRCVPACPETARRRSAAQAASTRRSRSQATAAPAGPRAPRARPTRIPVCGDGGCGFACDAGFSACSGGASPYTTAANCGSLRGCLRSRRRDPALRPRRAGRRGALRVRLGVPVDRAVALQRRLHQHRPSDLHNCGGCGQPCTTTVAHAHAGLRRRARAPSLATRVTWRAAGPASTRRAIRTTAAAAASTTYAGSRRSALAASARTAAARDRGLSCRLRVQRLDVHDRVQREPAVQQAAAATAAPARTGSRRTRAGPAAGRASRARRRASNLACISGSCAAATWRPTAPPLNACSLPLHTCMPAQCGGANTGCNGGCCTNLACGGNCVAGSSRQPVRRHGGRVQPTARTGCSPGPHCLANACGVPHRRLDCLAAVGSCSGRGMACSDAGACHL